jgi:hypothetical protein
MRIMSKMGVTLVSPLCKLSSDMNGQNHPIHFCGLTYLFNFIRGGRGWGGGGHPSTPRLRFHFKILTEYLSFEVHRDGLKPIHIPNTKLACDGWAHRWNSS